MSYYAFLTYQFYAIASASDMSKPPPVFMHVIPESFFDYLVVSVGFAVAYILLASVISPLAAFPGPLSAKLSSLWLVHQCRHTRRSEAVMNLHEKYGSDFVRIAHNHISINNPAAAAEIYGQRSGFVKSEFYDAFHQVRPVVFNTRDVLEHQRKRKYMNPAFSARALSKFEPFMNEELCKWKRKILDLTEEQNSVVIDLVTWTNFLAFDVIGSFAFGRSFGFIDAGEDLYDLIRTIDIRGEVLNALGVLPPWARPLMKYNFFDNFWNDGLGATTNLGKIGQEAFTRRKRNLKPREDLLSYLLSGRNEQTEDRVPDEEIIAESISFIVGGSDTTSSTMTNLFDFVARDQAIQQRLVDEINATFPGEMEANWVPSNSDLANMPFLNAVLREVMRVRPTSSTGLERVTPRGGKVIAGRFIPGGTIVSMSTRGLMNDGRIFDHPEKFDPDRWMKAGSNTLLEYFHPFSTGPRACIGRNFALMEILKALVVVLKLFRLERLSKGETVIREGFFTKAVECKVAITRRE